jgi:hypothetical protein
VLRELSNIAILTGFSKAMFIEEVICGEKNKTHYSLLGNSSRYSNIM